MPIVHRDDQKEKILKRNDSSKLPDIILSKVASKENLDLNDMNAADFGVNYDYTQILNSKSIGCYSPVSLVQVKNTRSFKKLRPCE